MVPQHMMGGALAWLSLAAATNMAELPATVGLPVAILASTFPDADKPNTWLSNRLNAFGTVLHWHPRFWWDDPRRRRRSLSGVIFGRHREGAHSFTWGIPLFAALAALPMLLTPVAWPLPAAVFAGASSHSLLDGITKHGVAWFWPFSKRRYGIALLTTRSWQEYGIAAPLLMIGTAWAFWGVVL